MANLKKAFSIADTAIKKVTTAVIGDVKAIFTTLVATDDAAATTAFIQACSLDGILIIPDTAQIATWAGVTGSGVDATLIDTTHDPSARSYIEYDYVRAGRGSFYGNVRIYLQFDGSSFAAGISNVSAANLQVRFSGFTGGDDIEKWKAFKHNDITSTSLGLQNYDGDNSSGGWDPSIGSTETTITAGALGDYNFSITGDLLAYINTQAQAQANVAFMLVNKRDYGGTAPVDDDNFFQVYLTQGSADSAKDPKLTYTYT